MMMKRFFSLLFTFLLVLAVSAQPGNNNSGSKFSPQQFDADLQKFITEQAALTPQEAARFFPVYKEMLHKQRMLFGRQRMLSREKPADEQACQKVIQERDQIDVELKRIQEHYHNKFLELLSPSKVYDVIMAEDKFHRGKLRQWGNGRQRMMRRP